MRKVKIFILIGAIAAVVACTKTAMNNAVVTNATPSTANTSPQPEATVAAISGSELYRTNCAICHRDDGTGGKITVEGKSIKPDNLTTAKLAAKSDEKIYGYIADGAPDDGMPPFRDKLKDQEIKEIVKFIRSSLTKTETKPAG